MSKNYIPHNPLEGERPELSINLQDGSDEHISIIVVHKDNPAYLNIAIQSIAVTSVNNNYEVIVVDNGSSGQDSHDFLSDLERPERNLKVIRNEKNLYWSEACNKGVAAANKNSKYFIFMHCDVVVLNKAWLDLLINVSQSQNSGLVGVELQSYLLQNQKIDFVQEWLCLMTRECFEAVGPWPDKLPQIGAPFIINMRAQQKGFKPQIMKNPIAYHYRAFSLDVNEYERLTEQAMVAIPQYIRELQSQPVK